MSLTSYRGDRLRSHFPESHHARIKSHRSSNRDLTSMRSAIRHDRNSPPYRLHDSAICPPTFSVSLKEDFPISILKRQTKGTAQDRNQEALPVGHHPMGLTVMDLLREPTQPMPQCPAMVDSHHGKVLWHHRAWRLRRQIPTNSGAPCRNNSKAIQSYQTKA